MASKLRVIHKMGNLADLPNSAGENELLYVEDAGKIYKGAGTGKPLIQFSDVITGYATLEALKIANPAISGKLYLTDDGVLAYYNRIEYVPVTGDMSGTVADSHTHNNITVLDLFSTDEFSNLLYDGIKIGESSGYNEVQSVDLKDGIQDAPVGSVISHIGLTAPKHYLICDGSTHNIADYPKLAEHFLNDLGSYNYFGGDGVTTFAVPDMRGEFVRGYDASNLRDPEGSTRGIGKHQDATNIPDIYVANYGLSLFTGINGTTDIQNHKSNQDVASEKSTYGYVYFNGSRSSSTTVGRYYTSRPTNVNALFCIKYEPTYYMEYHPKYATFEKDVLFEGKTSGDETNYELLSSVLDYEVLIIDAFIGATTSILLDVKNLKFGVDVLSISNMWSTSYLGCIPFTFNSEKVLHIFNPNSIGWSVSTIGITKITGIKGGSDTINDSGDADSSGSISNAGLKTSEW